MKKIILLLIILLSPLVSYALNQPETDKLIRQIDDRQRNSGDYKSLVYIEQKEKNKSDVVYQAVVYRRDEDDKLMILFLKPQSDAGRGYLRLNKNLFSYDPAVGKWERRTERENIGGTGSRRRDFDESRYSEEYNANFIAEEKLGKLDVYHIDLTAKPHVDVAYPIVKVWLDKQTGNLLKQQEFALSGRLMRTAYYPKWNKMFSQSKGADIYFPKEIRIYDEVEKGNQTIVLIEEVDLKSLDPNIFTKAWLESKSR